MGAAIAKVSPEEFEAEVLEAEQPVVVDFWAEWCAPCHMMAPVFEELAGAYGDRVKFAKVDVDQAQELAGRYGVMSIPTVIVFRDGEPVEQVIGFRGKGHLEQVVRQAAG